MNMYELTIQDFLVAAHLSGIDYPADLDYSIKFLPNDFDVRVDGYKFPPAGCPTDLFFHSLQNQWARLDMGGLGFPATPYDMFHNSRDFTLVFVDSDTVQVITDAKVPPIHGPNPFPKWKYVLDIPVGNLPVLKVVSLALSDFKKAVLQAKSTSQLQSAELGFSVRPLGRV